jgi:hypothetical protein
MLFFHVHQILSDLSDHCPVSAGLNIKHDYVPAMSDFQLHDLPEKFKWDQLSAERYQAALCSHDLQCMINDIVTLPNECTKEGVNQSLIRLRNIIITAANMSLKCVRSNKRKRSRNKKWFNSDLARAKKDIHSLGRLLCSYPTDPVIRGNYFRTLKEYRRKCKSEQRKFKAKVIANLDELYDQNPQSYWKLVNELRGKDQKHTISDPSQFYEHFKNLNTIEVAPTKERLEIIGKLKKLSDERIFNELDYKISETEISQAIRTLKNGKASGLDSISNEMLKAGQSALLPCLSIFFNNILNSGSYPLEWTMAKIIPLHKKGDFEDPENFRGIAISSCLGKLFNSIMNTRLCQFLKERDLLAHEQISSKKHHRPSDHMFMLKTLIDTCRNKRKSLFMCFVDFRKAFDMVWHDGLMFKLASLGPSSNFFSVIRSMYKTSSLTIQCNDKLTPNISIPYWSAARRQFKYYLI